MKKIVNFFAAALLCFSAAAFAQEETADLKPLLDAQMGKAKISVPKGRYHLDKTYRFTDLRNASVDLNGSEVIMRKRTTAFKISACENLKLSNFTLDYQPLCYTQLGVSAVSEDGKTWTLTLIRGYNEPETEGGGKVSFRLFDAKTKLLKRDFATMYGTLESAGEKNIYTLNRPSGANTPDDAVGNVVVITQRGGGHAFDSEYSVNLVFENITMYGAPSFSMYERGCSNSTYQNCVLTRKEAADPSLAFPRLCGGNADGIHVQNAPVGPKIRNCRAEHLGDDAITITSRYYPIYKIDERKGEIWVMSRERPVFGKGDSLVFLKNGGKIMGNSKCADMDGTDISQDEVDDCAKLFKRELIMQNRFKYGTRVKISPWIKGLEEGDIFNSVDRSGRGFVIENNFAGHTRARGIFVKASDGVIKNNAVEGCELAGIVLAQEVYYMSGGCFANVEISSNRVKDCLFGRTNASYTQAGAISVVAIDGQWQIADMGASKNIIVKNNTVEGCPLPCMLFTSIDGLTLKDNIIKPDFDMVRNWGSAVGIENSSEVFMKNVKLAE